MNVQTHFLSLILFIVAGSLTITFQEIYRQRKDTIDVQSKIDYAFKKSNPAYLPSGIYHIREPITLVERTGLICALVFTTMALIFCVCVIIFIIKII